MRVANPYRPGFNQSPAVLAGRSDVTDALIEALDVAALDARTPRPLLLVGSRGVGKTVLLEQARRLAVDRHSWVSADVEVRPETPFTPVLLARLRAAEQLYRQAPAGHEGWRMSKATLKASLMGIGAEAELERSAGEPVGDDALTTALDQAMDAAEERGGGLLLTIDEAHLAAKAELASLAVVLQAAVGKDRPLVCALAELPSLQDPRRMVTYLERGEWHRLGLLSDADAREALTGPAAGAGRPMEAEAATLLAEAAGGYPYAIQVVGHHTWRASTGAQTISGDHARAGAQAAQRDLSAGLYAARWSDCSSREREYLAALARLVLRGERPSAADVARALGQPAQAVTYLSARLQRKGTIYAEGRTLRLVVPGMADWIDAETARAPARVPSCCRGSSVGTSSAGGAAWSDVPGPRPLPCSPVARPPRSSPPPWSAPLARRRPPTPARPHRARRS